MSKTTTVLKLITAIAVSELAGVIGSFFTASSVQIWYPTLIKPAFSPPAWVFAPVWTTLYLLMGIAVFLVWSKGFNRRDVRTALAIFIYQLVLNTLWSVFFFGLEDPGAALIEIVSLLVAIIATVVAFARISRPAAWLFAPYLFWVSFAAYLNYALWALN